MVSAFMTGSRMSKQSGAIRYRPGVVIAFAFTSGVLHLPLSSDHTDSQQRLALVVLSFLAGFSERWAQDTLAAVAPVAAQPKPKPDADK